MMFENMEVVEEFYKAYAHNVAFSFEWRRQQCIIWWCGDNFCVPKQVLDSRQRKARRL